jgi:multicomponent Na+:H+ antiporter subunit D
VSAIVPLPVILPFAVAATTLGLLNAPRWQARIGVLGSLLHLAAAAALFVRVRQSGIQIMQVGDWAAPFGITLAADHLSVIMIMVTAVLGLAVSVYSRSEIGPRLFRAGYSPLLHILLGGVCGAFLTGDLFNLYVWFEVMLMASFGLLVLGGEKRQLDGGVKYVMINLFATLLFIAGVGLLYGMTGTLNLADLHLAVQRIDNQALLTAVAAIFMTAFGIKAGIFPLFFWLPVSYHTPPAAVSAILAGLLTKVGVYALIRLFSLVFIVNIAYTHGLLLAAAVLTMVTGVLAAAGYNEFRRILSVHIVSQVGYMVLGLALFTPLALAGSVFFLLHNMIVKSNLFLISGMCARISGTFELRKLGGLYPGYRLVSLLFFISAFSLAGFPPLSGFWGKLIIIRAGLESGAYAAAGAAVVVGLLTAYSMTKIWGEAFWKPSPDFPAPGEGPQSAPAPDIWMLLPVAGLACLTLIIGLMPGPFLEVADRAAHELTHPEIYVNAVLEGK